VRNVVIVLDDSCFAHSGCYGSNIETSEIDQLAKTGPRFTGFFTLRAILAVARMHAHRVAIITQSMRAISNIDAGFTN
jgi:hypothetical protein